MAHALMLATGITGTAKAVQLRAAGKIQEQQSVIDAAAEGDAARQREIARKESLLRAISSQQAAAGARGVAFSEGSPARIAQLDIDEATDDLLVDRANTLQRQGGVLSQGRAARRIGKIQSGAALLDTAVKVHELS